MTDTASTELEVSLQGPVCCLTMNRPQSKNGLTSELCAAANAALADAAKNPAVRAVMLTGAGGAFCSGLDLKAAVSMFQAMQQGGNNGGSTAVGGEHLRHYLHGFIRAVRATPKPVVAFLTGTAAGFGCDLALACDLRIGTSRASFSELFVKRGLMPDGGGTYSLPRLIGVGKALEMMFLGDVVESEEAARLGLLNRLVADEAAAWEFMRRLAAGPPLVLSAIKRAVYGASSASLDSALEFEFDMQLQLARSNDCAEGMTAFFMKRPPEFTGT
jgi:enoyl-CoA hydratase/carnithine racemase